MNMPKSIVNKVVARIRARDGGVVSATDLLDAGPRSAVDQALSRLVQQGKVLRVRRGLYSWPRMSALLNLPLSPPADELAQAWAKKNGLRIVPSGAYAANLLGLSTQVSAKIIYYTNGRTKTLKLGHYTIKLLNRGPRTMDVKGKVSPLVFQALRYLGKNGVTPQVISRLTALLQPKDKRELKRNISLAAAWMKPVLEEIIEGKKD